MTFTRAIPPEVAKDELVKMIDRGEIPPEVIKACVRHYESNLTRIYPVFSVFFLVSSLAGFYFGNIAMALSSLGPFLSGLYLTIISSYGNKYEPTT